MTNPATPYTVLKAWFAHVSGISENDVSWDGEPIGMQSTTRAMLTLKSQGIGPGVDELRYVDDGAGNLNPEIVGNRRLVLSCRVETRDQSPEGKAQTYLDRVSVSIMVPTSREAFARAGVGYSRAENVISYESTSDMRALSVAVLDLHLNGAVDVVFTDKSEQVGTIEKIGIGGTASDGSATVTTPNAVIP